MDIRLENISKQFGDQLVLDNFSMYFPEGKVSCLMGPSGCGKSTLLAIMMGLIKPDQGKIMGLENKLVAAVFQEDRLCENLSPVANVRLVCAKNYPRQAIVTALTAVDLADCLTQPVRQLSGGMRRRVALVRALLAESTVLLLDEPFKGLDGDTKKRIVDFMMPRIAGKTVVMVTHDPTEVDLVGGTNYLFPD